MSGAYFDTTQLALPLLERAQTIAEGQCEQVLAIFARHPHPLTPSQVWALGKRGADERPLWLLTSVRRSITVLTKRNQLERCEAQQVGLYGRPEYQWRRVAQVPV